MQDSPLNFPRLLLLYFAYIWGEISQTSAVFGPQAEG